MKPIHSQELQNKVYDRLSPQSKREKYSILSPGIFFMDSFYKTLIIFRKEIHETLIVYSRH